MSTLKPGKSKTARPTPYKSPLHGPVDVPKERGWLRYQVQGHPPKLYWEPVAQYDDRNRALLDGLKRARVGKIPYRVWDRLERKEIWRGFGYGASVEAWAKDRPPGLIGQNKGDRSGEGKRGRWSYTVLATNGWFGPFLTKERAMVLLARVRRRIAVGDPSPLYEGQGELVIGRIRRSPGGWEFALPGGYVTYHWDKARDAVKRAIRARPRPNDRRRAMSITTRPLRFRPNPVLSRRMIPLRENTMRLGDAMRYGRALLDAGYVVRLWDGSGWEVVIHPNDSMATMSGKGPSGGRAYLSRGAGMVKTWPITLLAYHGQRSLGWMTPGKVRALLAKRRVSANPAEESPTFYIMHVNVDGAGIHTKGITLKRRAIALAQRLQAKSDKGGNPWGYRYIVYRTYPSGTRSDAIYRTKSRAASNPKHYEVIVGNIGTVYSGPSVKEARRKYSAYVAQSKSGRGRAGGESVVLMAGGEIVREHAGTQQENSHRRASRKRRSDDNPRIAHTAIVGAFLAGKRKRFGSSREMPGSRYATDGQQLKVWGHVVAEKVPGGIKLYDAGYQTLLTKNVLNTVLDALNQPRISQMRHRWYIGGKEWMGEATIPTGAMANRRRKSARRNRGGRWYYGHKKSGGVEKFWSAKKPTEKSHGHRYTLVTGPFKGTKAMDTIFGFHWHAGPKTIRRRGKVSAIANTKKLLGKSGYRRAMKFA